ncbi:uncharacterized protein TNIN_287751 [Trichonephila inaurata madagascariensis]|uniref:Uncharacterized protein n=1 Tax=Trichonephila inaurata madagascariensis TaxID=2747483 RepID=A0A8X7CHQ7_9ARAC|nr:uncharacterized protein TNIN_287751 [Trichonephila inaurata madagascariensis]
MKLTSEMNMKIVIYLGCKERKIPLIKLSIGGHHILERPLETNIESCLAIVFGWKDKQLLLEISPDACDKIDESPVIRLDKGKKLLLNKAIRVNEESITMFA